MFISDALVTKYVIFHKGILMFTNFSIQNFHGNYNKVKIDFKPFNLPENEKKEYVSHRNPKKQCFTP